MHFSGDYFWSLQIKVMAAVTVTAASSPTSAVKKTIVMPSDIPSGQQFVVTQSKGTTIIQPAGSGGTQYIVTG